jgi:hypothetical protein
VDHQPLPEEITMLYKELSDAELVAAYWDLRGATHASGQLACHVNPRSRGGRTLARTWGRQLNHFEIVCALLRKRNVNPLTHKS